MAGPREVVISYGTFSTNDANVYLNGVHTLNQDEREFMLEYDVVVQASSADAVKTTAAAMITQLNERHLDLIVTVGGSKLYHFVDGTDGVPAADEEGAEFIIAEWELLGTHRTTLSRAYRITVRVTRAAQQPNKFGVFEQSISLSSNAVGRRSLRFRAVFTPGPNATHSGTAKDRHDDATYGFNALAAGVLLLVGGTWESTGKNEGYEEDQRRYFGSGGWQELIYDQSDGYRNDNALVNVQYDIRVERDSARGIPDFVSARPLTGLAVTFSAGVAVGYSGTLQQAIEDVALPYIRNTVALTLTAGDKPILLGHGLRADPVNSRIAGQVLFLIEEDSTVLEVNKTVTDEGNTGITYVPVLDGTPFTRDKHIGPALWIRLVTFTVRVRGRNTDNPLEQLEKAEIKRQAGFNFELVNWSARTVPNVEVFREAGGGQLETTVQTRSLLFVCQNRRGAGKSLAQMKEAQQNNDLPGHGARAPYRQG